YGSLTITNFRGFSQFGTIGFVGMLLVWLSVIPLVPAMLALGERFGIGIAPVSHREGTAFTRFVARATERKAIWFVAGAAIVSVAAFSRLPRYFHDPWEYDFDKLGSVGSKASGAGHWSNVADRAFGGKTNVAGALMLADTP